MRFTLISLCAALTLATAGCSTTNPDVVSRQQAQRLQTVRSATVLSVRQVVVDGTQSGLGAATGAVLGGVAGSSVGGHRDAIAAGLLLGVAGAALGNAIERSVTTEPAVELTLRMADGSRQVLVQAKGAHVFQAGERVDVVSQGNSVRVVPAP